MDGLAGVCDSMSALILSHHSIPALTRGPSTESNIAIIQLCSVIFQLLFGPYAECYR